MDKIRESDIARIVDEVVRRVEARTAPVPESVCCPTAAKAAQAPPTAASSDRQDETLVGKRLLDTGACRVGVTGTAGIECGQIAPYIDHTLLKPDATESDIDKLCREARQHGFASVCVNTSYVEQCARLLSGTAVKVCCVVGFPLGAMSTEAKAFEARDAVRRGAEEVDMVINVGKLQSGNYGYVCDDIRAVVNASGGHTVKVILETGMLDDTQKIAACVLAKAAGADFVKTSTGFGKGGATPEDIALMRRIVGEQMGVKASGGIRDCPTAQQMIESGATRIGASASVNIIKGASAKGGY